MSIDLGSGPYEGLCGSEPVGTPRMLGTSQAAGSRPAASSHQGVWGPPWHQINLRPGTLGHASLEYDSKRPQRRHAPPLVRQLSELRPCSKPTRTLSGRLGWLGRSQTDLITWPQKELRGTCPPTTASTRTPSLHIRPGGEIHDTPGRYQVAAGSGLHTEEVTGSISVQPTCASCLSFATRMGPGSCHEYGTTWSAQRAW